jgi:Ca2+ transporting ATPase
MLFAGTKVLTGDGYFVTLAVGENSSIGQIKALIMTETEATPLQQKLERIARDIGKFGLVSAILTLVVLLLRFLITMGINDTWSEGNQYKQLIDFFLICVAIIVVAIPEGLPVAVTLSLAFSVRKMMKDNNLVRRLEACETMGGANNICSDKTGTLTQNKMSLTKMWNDNMIDIDVHKKKDELNHYIKEEHQKNLLVQGIICNASATLDPPKGSKTDIALLEFMQKCGINFEEQRAKFLPEGFRKFPFSSARKRQSTILQNVEESKTLQRLHIKGASELILESATHFYSFESNQVIPLTAELRAKCDNTITEMASLALRTLCLAYKDIEPNDDLEASDANGIHEIEKNNLILFCIVGIKDVLRPNVKESVEKCRKAGIRVRMVTGDNKLTAAAIAKECGIIKADNPNSLVMEGKEFQARTGGVICKHCKVAECPCPRTEIEAKRMNKPVRVDIIQNIEEFKKIASQLDVLARSRPIDKYALVTGLKELGNVVAVTGDGTNDAPALKKANVGFAMGISGTEVAKEAAAIILMDDNFTSIVKAVMWGRNIYDCIKKFLQFQLTVNVVATICVFIGAAVLRQSVFNVVQLLWLNLIMDTLAALALATEPPTEELLNRKPHKKDEYIISRIMVKHILGQAVYQIAVIMVIVFSGDQWVPEYLTPSADLPADVIWSNPTSSGQHYVRSGRIYHLDGEDPDYIHLYDEYGPSRHFTFVFNTFVFMQIFNFFNCRKLRDEKNIFEGLGRSKTFIAIMLFIIGGQLIIGNLGGRAVGISLHYMDARQWLIAAAFGFGGWIVSLLLKILVPKRLFLKAGKAKADPVRSKSAILNLKRSNSQQSIQRKFSLQQQGTIGSKKPSIQSAVVPPPPHYPSAIELPRVASNFEIHYVK